MPFCRATGSAPGAAISCGSRRHSSIEPTVSTTAGASAAPEANNATREIGEMQGKPLLARERLAPRCRS